MESVENTPEPQNVQSGKLLKILGVAFGIAVSIGATVGVGILRNPGLIAEQLNSVWLIMAVWLLGGIYVLLSANYLAEFATMIPKAGGYYVYSLRAFGRYGGFVVGWSDWLFTLLGLSFITIVFGEYASGLFTPDLYGGRIIFSVAILVAITVLNLIGLRAGSETQKIMSFLKAVGLIAFVVACFIYGGEINPADVPQVTTAANASFIVAFILSFQFVLSTFDGWHSPIYFSEENTNPAKSLPRSMFGGVILIAAIYLLVNLALVYILPMSKLAGSQFAGADAMSLMFGEMGGQILTVLALVSLIGIINAILLLSPRILFGLARESFFVKSATKVNDGGTPVVATLVTFAAALVLASTGSFELLVAISQFFIVVISILTILTLFVLRRTEPDLPRPFKTWGYPYAPALMLLLAVLLFFGYIYSNPYPSLYALGVLAASYPIFRLIKQNN